MNDITVEELIKRVIREELGSMVSEELRIRFEPIHKQIDTIQSGQDSISKQLTEDRRDINQIKIDQTKIAKSVGIVIDNQNHQEDVVVQAVAKETEKIPGKVEQGIEKVFKKEPLLKRLIARFKKRGG
jgi:Skp family chaperone for outer membrane proteins